MAAPLGLDSDCFATQDTNTYSSNHLSTAAAISKDDDFETLIVDDSEPPDPHPKRLRRLLTVSSNTLHSTAVVDEEDVDMFSSQDDRRNDEHICTPDRQNREQSVSNDHESVCKISPPRGFELIDSDTEKPSISRQCNAHRYFFHDDSRIQELVRNRLPNFCPLGNRDLDHHLYTSTIDYKGQFSHGESSNRKNKDKKSSSSRKTSKRSKIEEESQGWVNPKLSIDKGFTKGTTKRKVYEARQTAGRWLTDLDGKKVYLSKNGVELSGQVAYKRYRKESGAGFKKAKKRTSAKK